MRDAVKIALFGVLCLIWGSTWLVIKVGYGGLGPFNVAGVRFALAAAVLAVIVPIVGARWPRGRSEWSLVLFVGVFLFAGDYGLIYWGEQYIDSGLTAILFGTFPLITMIAAHVYVPGEHLAPRKLGGSVVAFLIYFSLLKTWDSTTVSFFGVFTPAIALFLGAAVLGERLSRWSLAGSVLILAGVLMTLLTPHRASPGYTE